MPPKKRPRPRHDDAPQYKLGIMLQHNLRSNLATTNDFQMSESELMHCLNSMGISELPNAEKYTKATPMQRLIAAVACAPTHSCCPL